MLILWILRIKLQNCISVGKLNEKSNVDSRNKFPETL